jgi:hypothetical protein
LTTTDGTAFYKTDVNGLILDLTFLSSFDAKMVYTTASAFYLKSFLPIKVTDFDEHDIVTSASEIAMKSILTINIWFVPLAWRPLKSII